ncbi:MAG TPA: GTPase Era [Acidiphilium sp.]|nr:MAG: GTPase Era [Acidiphilium sp. 21-60-14]OYV92194.1 MAG: GTPase Era [Acidiphilium sp. 37-60-79]OZB40621.1 MAG: GTPase Era [Acidiphilium sp. 34-60-192]HQT87440.1 GTPase Era [Acidiphilium sp.]HQU23146.1 GTPase Era [Acidiphilium sp.]
MNTRCGYVALLGRPNAGKSTLLNQAVGAKVSIVTPKAQTTRFRVSGILLRDQAQIILVDTPGLFAPKRRLDRAMVQSAWDSVAGADLACMLVDAFRARPDDLAEPLTALAKTGRTRWLVLNKIDLLPRDKLLPLADTLGKMGQFDEVFMISALKRDGVDSMLDAMGRAMPEGPFLYPPDELTDQTDRMLAAELVREQIFLQTREEIPYGASVETESFKDLSDGAARIDVTIYVARTGHKMIILGESGARIKSIGSKARAELERLLERRVHLFLHVKDRPGWDEETARLRALGLDG